MTGAIISSASQQERPESIHRPGLGRPWVIIPTVLAIFIVSQFLAAVIVVVALNVLKPGIDLETALKSSAGAQFIYILIAESAAVASVLIIVKKLKKKSFAVIGFGRMPIWKDVVRALMGAGAFYGLLILSSIFTSVFVPGLDREAEQDVGFKALNSSTDYLLAYVALAILPPIGEETLMRGYLYSGLRTYLKFAPAMLVTSVLFGIAHLGSGAKGVPLWAAALDTFLLSIVLVYLREKTGALYAPILLHGLNNSIAYTVYIS